MRNLGLVLALAGFIGLAACGSNGNDGPVLYGTTFGAAGNLVQLDPDTGALLRTIGPIGYQVNGLEWDHSTGKLFATTSGNDANFPSGLLEINPATGAGTPIGAGFGRNVMNPTVNAAGAMYAWTENGDDLVTVDKVAGTVTVVGDAGLSTLEHGVAFDNQGTLYIVNGSSGNIFTIDTATGATTAAGSLTMRAHHGDFHPVTGLYWGIDETADSSALATRNIRVVNIGTATVTTTLPTADNLFTLSFRR